MRILRLTRHEASSEQLAELRRVYGADSEIIQIFETVPNAQRVREMVGEAQADVLEAVLPMTLIAELTDPRSGVKFPVIRAITRRELIADGSAIFHFDHYEKVVKVEVVTERL